MDMKVRRFLVIARGWKEIEQLPKTGDDIALDNWNPFYGSDDAPKGLHEKGPRTGNVDALESISFGSEQASFIQKDTSLVQEEVSKLMFVQAEGATVEPDKISPLGLNDFDFRDIALKKTRQLIQIVIEIVQKIFKPWFSLFICDTARCCAEGIDSEQTVGKETFFEFLTGLSVRDEDVGSLKACQVEGFTRCGADDTVFLKGAV